MFRFIKVIDTIVAKYWIKKNIMYFVCYVFLFDYHVAIINHLITKLAYEIN